MSKECPSCGSSEVRRSSFRSSEERQLHVFESPYRCIQCRLRFWVISRKSRHTMIETLILMIVAMTIGWVITARVARQPPPALPSIGAIVLPTAFIGSHARMAPISDDAYPSDVDAVYARYLEMCERLGIEPLPWDRTQFSIVEWSEAIAA